MAYTSADPTAAPPVREQSRWFLIEGIALIVLGVAALLLPLAAGVVAGAVLGWALVISGIVGLLATWRGLGHLHRTWSTVSAAIAILAGLLIAFNPLAGAVGLTLLVAAYLFVDGVSHIGLAIDHRRRAQANWGWVLAVGVFDILLALLILLLGPIGAGALVGFIVGVDLIIGGVVLLGLWRGRAAAAAAL